jgi:hypothetical protein
MPSDLFWSKGLTRRQKIGRWDLKDLHADRRYLLFYFLFHLLVLSFENSNTVMQGKTRFVEAAKAGDTAAVRALIAAKANVEATVVSCPVHLPYNFSRSAHPKVLLIAITVVFSACFT